MSITELDKIDGIGKGKDNKKLLLMLSDHLDWKNEYEHLIMLQDKINAYIGYIESQQFQEVYPNETFNTYVIKVYFKYNMTENCKKFLETISNQLVEHNIQIDVSN